MRLKDVAARAGFENYNFDTKYKAADGRPRHPARDRRERAGDRDRAAGQVDELSVLPARPRRPLSVRHDAVRALSIEEVVKTLLEGIVLVFLVMYLFLQNLRATIIPTIAVPVVLLGTFAIMGVGFSINTLSMFGLVLAIGLLVDDAIVVVRTSSVMAERACHRRRRPARRWVRSPAHSLAWRSLSAVFVPVAFRGSVGAIYRSFADDRVGDGAVGARRVDSDAGTVRDDPEADPEGHHEEKKVLRLVQPHVQRSRDVPRRREPRDPRSGRWLHLSRVHRGRRDVRAPAEVVPAG